MFNTKFIQIAGWSVLCLTVSFAGCSEKAGIPSGYDIPAEAAVQIANTGHTVFSTLHTNSSYSVPQRLSSLGVKTHLMASALSGVIAQRLVRKNCPHCLEAYKPSQHTMDRLELSSNETYYRGSGHTAAGTVCSRSPCDPHSKLT